MKTKGLYENSSTKEKVKVFNPFLFEKGIQLDNFKQISSSSLIYEINVNKDC